MTVCIDRARVWTSEFPDVFSRANGDDSIRVDRYGLGGWLRRIHRVDHGVDDDRVSNERPVCRFDKTRGKRDERDQQECGFHRR